MYRRETSLVDKKQQKHKILFNVFVYCATQIVHCYYSQQFILFLLMYF